MNNNSKNNPQADVVKCLRDHALDLLLGIPSIVTICGFIKRFSTNEAGSNVYFTNFELLLGVAVLVVALLWIVLLRRRLFVVGEEAGFSYRWRNLPDCTNSYSIASIDTEHPTVLIDYSINLGPDYAGREVFIEEYRSMVFDRHLNTTCDTFNEDGVFSWKPDKIKKFRYYVIRWNWISDDESKDE